MSLPVMSESSAESVIHVPIDAIDLTEWVFTLTDDEYQACSKVHIAAGATVSRDGKRMSINVEYVGRLLIQHYVEGISERAHCRLVSLSDAFGASFDERSRSDVMWEFAVEDMDGARCRFINHVKVTAVPGWEEGLKKQGLTLEQAQERSQINLAAHNQEETPLFAQDIQRKALAGRWKI